MTSRWLAGAVLFGLGFGSALLVRPAADAANTAVKEVPVEGTTLKYIDGPDDFRLKYPAGGKADYFVAVVREPGSVSQSSISYKIGEVVVSKRDLQSLTVFQAKPLISLQPKTTPVHASLVQAAAVSARPFRVIRCGEQVYCPLPPPPDPPIWSMVSVKPAGFKR